MLKQMPSWRRGGSSSQHIKSRSKHLQIRIFVSLYGCLIAATVLPKPLLLMHQSGCIFFQKPQLTSLQVHKCNAYHLQHSRSQAGTFEERAKVTWFLASAETPMHFAAPESSSRPLGAPSTPGPLTS